MIKSFSEGSLFKNTITFIKLIKEFKPSLVHFHYNPPPYQPINIYCYIKRIPIVYTEHFAPNIPSNKKLLKHRLKQVKYILMSKLFNIGICKIICVSKFVKSNFEKYYKLKSKKLVIIYNGINIQRFKPINKITANQNIPIVCCIGGLVELKGVQYLIRTAPLVINKVPDVKFYIVGDGHHAGKLKKMVQDMNLKDYFIFTGWRSDVEKFLSMSTVSAIPTLYYEAYCFAAVESLAMSVPVIASDIGGLKEIIENGKTGFLIPLRDFRTMAERIIELIKNPDMNNQFGIEGRRLVEERFSLERTITEYMQLYQDILH